MQKYLIMFFVVINNFFKTISFPTCTPLPASPPPVAATPSVAPTQPVAVVPPLGVPARVFRTPRAPCGRVPRVPDVPVPEAAGAVVPVPPGRGQSSPCAYLQNCAQNWPPVALHYYRSMVLTDRLPIVTLYRFI